MRVSFPMHCINFVLDLIWFLNLVLGKWRLFRLLLEAVDWTRNLRAFLFALRIGNSSRLKRHRIVFDLFLLLLFARFLVTFIRFLRSRWNHLHCRNFYINLINMFILIPFSFGLQLHVFFLSHYSSNFFGIKAEWFIFTIFRSFELLKHGKATSRCLLMQTRSHTSLRTRLDSGTSEIIEDCLSILVHWFNFSLRLLFRVLIFFKNWST